MNKFHVHFSSIAILIDTLFCFIPYKQVEEIPSDFPFKINKHDGLTDVTLTRSLKGEQIEVLVSMQGRRPRPPRPWTILWSSIG